MVTLDRRFSLEGRLLLQATTPAAWQHSQQCAVPSVTSCIPQRLHQRREERLHVEDTLWLGPMLMRTCGSVTSVSSSQAYRICAGCSRCQACPLYQVACSPQPPYTRGCNRRRGSSQSRLCTRPLIAAKPARQALGKCRRSRTVPMSKQSAWLGA